MFLLRGSRLIPTRLGSTVRYNVCIKQIKLFLFLGLNVQYDVTKAGKLNLALLLESCIFGKGKHRVDAVSGHNMILLLLKKGANWRTLQIFENSSPAHDVLKLDFTSGI